LHTFEFPGGDSLMGKKQILILFVCSLVMWTAGNGLIPLLPVYAKQLGADPAAAGYYLSFSYLALAAGALSAGWVSDRFQSRKLPQMIAGLLAIPVTWLMGQATSILSLTLLTALLWFCGGLGLALVGILTGLSAGEGERGKIFGILSLSSGLGALLGGLSTGVMVQHWGYSGMFTVLAGFILLWPLSAFFLAEVEVKQAGEKGAPAKIPGLGRAFYFLFAASLVASITGFIVLLVRSFLMNDLGFGVIAISSTGAIGGIATLPLPFLIGWLSDRRGRKIFLYFGYLAGFASVSFLVFSTLLWHFWVVVLLQSLFGTVTTPTGNALATDLLPPQALGKGLALFNTASWMGGVLGFAGGGYALKSFGFTPTLLIGIGLAVFAMVLLIPVRGRAPQVERSLQPTLPV
jgi:MFS family permease